MPSAPGGATIFAKIAAAGRYCRTGGLMSRLLLLSTLTTAACTGGIINAELTLPHPGGVSESNGITTFSPGILVDTEDGTGVCERIRVRVYTSAAPPANPAGAPVGVTPVGDGHAIGSYTADKPQCLAVAANLPPRDDYWMLIEYPAHGASPAVAYYTYGVPVLGAPVPITGGFYPVKVTDKQTTTVRATLVLPPKPSVPGV
jgi:hypothetical protein